MKELNFQTLVFKDSDNFAYPDQELGLLISVNLPYLMGKNATVKDLNVLYPKISFNKIKFKKVKLFIEDWL